VGPGERDFYKRLGGNVQAARKKLKWTQTRLGSSLDPPLVKASVAQIEAGRQRVFAHTLFQFAQILNMSPIALVGEPGVESRRDNRVRSILARELPEADVEDLLVTVQTIAGNLRKVGLVGKWRRRP
jgi:transcriptional regulator with XRE-family HTH domain